MDTAKLKEKLIYRPKNGYDRIASEEKVLINAYCEDYKAFLNAGRTERECVSESIRLAEAQGFVPYSRGMDLKPGAKIYKSIRGKMLLLAVIGQKSLAEGAQIAAAHIDSPRLDLKPVPLYEEAGMAYLKTHYYGGVRKYQWAAIPLELRGTVALRSGETAAVAIGAGDDEPKLFISDLLPHLGDQQDKKTLAEGITGEQLNILTGSIPLGDDEKDRVKLAVLQLFYEKYGITEEDFTSAELEVVPAFPPCDVGLDGSMIGGYGQDDRVCAYPALRALLEREDFSGKTAVCILADKEEIGSCGVSGMQTAAFDTFMSDICGSQNVPLAICLENSFCFSADVTSAFDPNFPDVFDKHSAARFNYGVALCKYTGHRGKKNASDASAEIMSYTRRILDENGVIWQTSEMGAVDAGGGGTVSRFMANRNIDTLDLGVPLLAMHAPFEVSAKLDCYMTYKAMQAVYKN